jgi:uncharacterized protein YdaU (DUF1376 family)
MHYYQFNIGDYASHTRHLTIIEDLAYRRLLDMYYLHEKPLDSSIEAVARLIGMREYVDEVEMVLLEFFECLPPEGEIHGWVNTRADKEITAYKGFIEAGKRGASKRWAKTDSPPIAPLSGNDSPPIAPPIANNKQEPLNNKHKTVKSKALVDYTDEFLDFWKAYPRKVQKPEAFKAWNNQKPNLQDVLLALSWQRESKNWTKDDGDYIPYPASYINGQRWHDEPIEVKRTYTIAEQIMGASNGNDRSFRELNTISASESDGKSFPKTLNMLR